MDYEALRDHNDEERQRLNDEAAIEWKAEIMAEEWQAENMEAEDLRFLYAFERGKTGRQPQEWDALYLDSWACGFAQLIVQKKGFGWVPTLEWKPTSQVTQWHCEATSPIHDDPF